MPPTRIFDLLPIAEGTRDPHAYQVLGLPDGEQDSKVIAAAVRSTMARLMAVKKQTDSKLWMQAARLAQSAQRTLADPQLKAQLDARFGIISVSDETDDASGGSDPLAGMLPSKDPLAAVLPAADPLAKLLPATDPLAPTQDPTEPGDEPKLTTSPAQSRPSSQPPKVRLMPGLFGTPAEPPEATPTDPPVQDSAPKSPGTVPPGAVSPVAVSPDAESIAAKSLAAESPPPQDVAPQSAIRQDEPGAAVDAVADASSTANLVDSIAPVVVEPKRKKRSRSSAGTLMLATVAVAMLGLVAILGYFLIYGPGEVAITKTDGKITISTQPSLSASRGGRDPDSSRTSRQSTGPGNRSAATDNSDGPNGVAIDLAEQDWGDSDVMAQDWGDPPQENVATEMTPTSDLASDPDPMPDSPADLQPEAPMGSDPGSMPAEDPTIADEALKRLGDMIRQSRWSELTQAAEAVSAMRLSNEQELDAEAYRDLVRLAVDYRSAIVRAAANLQEDEEFAITDSFRIRVVESTDERLVVQYAGKEKRLAPDEFPFPLAHKLASTELPASPLSDAAKATYQAIAPRSNDGYRTQSLQWLTDLEETVLEVDIPRIRRLIESLFDEDA